MTLTSYSFTAFAEKDLFAGHVAKGLVFTQPDHPTLTFTVEDNDAHLSGDFLDFAIDMSEQEASIARGSEEQGNGRQIYAEKVIHLDGDDGQEYQLVQIEQEGSAANYYTYVGMAPPAGVMLTVGNSNNVLSVDYAKLEGAVPLPNIVDIAVGSDDFNILVKALSAAGLVETVQGLSDVTVFAPTDAAFVALAAGLGFTGDTSDEDAVFAAIAAALTELGDGDPIPLLTDILLYHVSAGAKTKDEIDALDAVPTLLTGATFGSEDGELIDNEPDVANPNIVLPDLKAANGTIQAIDRVLLPIDIPGNEPATPSLAGIVAASGGTFDDNGADFDLLFNAVKAAGLVEALDDPDASLTVFAPNDDAFVGLAQALGFEGTDEGAAFSFIVEALTLLSGGADPIPLLTDILLYHVAPGALDAATVLGSETIPTLLGSSLGVNGATLVDADPDIPDPGIILTDIPAANGIAHVLNGVLIPVDILNGDGSAGAVDFLIGTDATEPFSTGSNTDFVSGLGGNDLILLGDGDDVGLGGTGNDRLYGLNGRDVLNGGDGDDLLNGGRHKDVLTGGADADVFLFKRASGQDTITDFAVGEDTILLKNFGFSEFQDVSDLITDVADGALIDLGHVEITLTGVAASDLTQDDFAFL